MPCVVRATFLKPPSLCSVSKLQPFGGQGAYDVTCERPLIAQRDDCYSLHFVKCTSDGLNWLGYLLRVSDNVMMVSDGQLSCHLLSQRSVPNVIRSAINSHYIIMITSAMLSRRTAIRSVERKCILRNSRPYSGLACFYLAMHAVIIWNPSRTNFLIFLSATNVGTWMRVHVGHIRRTD